MVYDGPLTLTLTPTLPLTLTLDPNLNPRETPMTMVYDGPTAPWHATVGYIRQRRLGSTVRYEYGYAVQQQIRVTTAVRIKVYHKIATQHGTHELTLAHHL